MGEPDNINDAEFDKRDLGRQADEIARNVGLDIGLSEELLKAENLWLKGDAAGCLAETKRVVENVRFDKARKLADSQNITLKEAFETLGSGAEERTFIDRYGKGQISDHKTAFSLYERMNRGELS